MCENTTDTVAFHLVCRSVPTHLPSDCFYRQAVNAAKRRKKTDGNDAVGLLIQKILWQGSSLYLRIKVV